MRNKKHIRKENKFLREMIFEMYVANQHEQDIMNRAALFTKEKGFTVHMDYDKRIINLIPICNEQRI